MPYPINEPRSLINIMTQQKPLTVYNASAGSGKTFTLAVEYIALLVKCPEDYKHILAVTFTNKATEEMKQRILSQLYGLSRPTTLKESKDYLEKIKIKTRLSEPQIQTRSAQALHYLLNDYSSFHIETIDSFFQRILRNLARELELTPNLRLELNDTEVEGMAVDHMIASLRNGHTILDSIMSFIYEKISKNNSWNVISSLKKFGKEIFSDIYKEKREFFESTILGPNADQMDEQEKEQKWNQYFDDAAKKIEQSTQQYVDKVKACGQEYFDLLSQNHLIPKNINGGEQKEINLYFNKLRSGQYEDSVKGKNFDKFANDAAHWRKPSDKKLGSFVEDVAQRVLIPHLEKSEEIRKECKYYAHSAKYTLQYLNQLKLLTFVDREVRRLNADANRFLLSDTQHLLQAFIKDTDAPFIYEKIGGHLKHIMIDEFQDTSTIQWRNFKVLIDECMSHNDQDTPSTCLIVGDVKQSIYRWRGGDWRLLNDIDGQFANAKSMIHHEPLKTNFRSCEYVIRFNNAFFSSAEEYTCEQLLKQNIDNAQQLEKAYQDVVQEVSGKNSVVKRGYVRMQLLPFDEDASEKILSDMSERIWSLLKAGQLQSDIAILVRYNHEIPDIAEWFNANQPDIRMISDLAFQLDSSAAVNTIIAAMRCLNNPQDLLSQAYLIKVWNRIEHGGEQSESELLCTTTERSQQLPTQFIDKQEELISMPIPQLAESIYSIFKLSTLKGDEAYISTFFDALTKFVQDNTADICSLLNYWDNYLHQKCIQSDTVDGVRITTIHKSKGLEYKHVFLPFCDWKVTSQDYHILCDTKDAPYNLLPIVYVRFGNHLMETIYENDFKEEYLQIVVDNLNLMYVAFTRARNSLFIYGRTKEEKTKNASELRSELMAGIIEKVAKEIDASLECQDQSYILEYGKFETAVNEGSDKGKTDDTGNVFLKKETSVFVPFVSFPQRASFTQSNDSKRFVEYEEEDEKHINEYIHRGNVIHAIMSRLRTTADVERVLQELENDGIIYTEDINRKELVHIIQRSLQHPLAKDWFSDKWTIYTECTILEEVDGVVIQRRPDRVMTDQHETIVIDYKSGHERDETKAQYENQVLSYMTLLKEMGFPQVKGYLWYLGEQKITPVIQKEV